MVSPSPWRPVSRECLWKKTQIEIKQEKILGERSITEDYTKKIALYKLKELLSEWLEMRRSI